MTILRQKWSKDAMKDDDAMLRQKIYQDGNKFQVQYTAVCPFIGWPLTKEIRVCVCVRVDDGVGLDVVLYSICSTYICSKICAKKQQHQGLIDSLFKMFLMILLKLIMMLGIVSS